MQLERNVYGILEKAIHADFAHQPAFGFPGGRTLTFVELHDRVEQLARSLATAGVTKGDRVAVLMNSRQEWVELYFALAAVGAVCVPVNIYLVPAEIDAVLADCTPKALVYDEESRERIARIDYVAEVRVEAGLVAGETPLQGAVSFEDFHASGDDSVEFSGPDLADPFLIYYSSGTTGTPKGTVHSHDGVLWNAIGQWLGFELDRDVRYGVVPSLSWAAGFNVVVTAGVWIGAYSFVRPTGGATAESVVEMLVEQRITHVNIVPALLTDIMRRPDLVDRLRGGSLEWVLVGSAPVPLALLEQASAELPQVAVVQGYGFSEFPALVSVLKKEEALGHPGSAGRPLPITRVAVRADDGSIQPHGRGELLVRSPATMIGYYNRPDDTEEAFRDGWFHSGDIVELEQSGFITILGRTREMIISGGLNIYPKEIEDVVIRVEGVQECAVVAVPHDRYGESVAVAVYTLDSSFDPATIEVVCKERLASYKRPRHVIVSREPLPRNSNGKLLKREVKTWVAEQVSLMTTS